MSCRIPDRVRAGSDPASILLPPFTGFRLSPGDVWIPPRFSPGVTRRHDDFDNILLPEGEESGLREGFRNRYSFVLLLGQ
jgi:hypothetical protein